MNLQKLAWVLVCCYSGAVYAGMLEVSIQNNRVYLQADNVSLVSVLEKFSEKGDFRFHSTVPLTAPVTLTIEGQNIEETAKRLLVNHSYLMAYRTRNNQESLAAIDILDTKGDTGDLGILPVHRESSLITTVDDDLEVEADVRVKPETIRKQIGGVIAVSRQGLLEDIEVIARELIANGSERNVPKRSGKRSKHTAAGVEEQKLRPTAFGQIGIDSQNITTINGRSVGSKEDLVQKLQQASQEKIVRVTIEGNVLPIYLDVSDPDATED